MQTTTIAAVCTGRGGAIAVLRVSGKDAFYIVNKIFRPLKKGLSLLDAVADRIYNGFIIGEDGSEIDRVVLTIYRAPRSYTGEDVVEISCHASSYIQNEILSLLFKNGAEPAENGGFTRRAFQNKKMDLPQAEAVADLIAAKSKAEHDIAVNQMRGGITKEISRLRELLLKFTSLMELELDFSEEDVEFADRSQLKEILKETENYLSRLVKSFKYGNAIKSGVPVAICGQPNAGKSTLLNALLNDERAIVTDIPGTTRDVLEDFLTLDGVLYRLIDTAGIRETDDKIEKIGISKAKDAILKSEIVLIVLDPKDDMKRQFSEIIPENFPKEKIIAVVNKSDIVESFVLPNLPPETSVVKISAKQKTGIEDLLQTITKIYGADYSSGDVILTNQRHYEAFSSALTSVERAENALESGLSGEFVSQDIREALRAFAEITGDEITTDEVLGNIFKNFCIGK